MIISRAFSALFICVFLVSCGKAKAPLAGPVTPDKAKVEKTPVDPLAEPAAPASGVDIHKIPKGRYRLVSAKHYSKSQWNKDSDHTLAFEHKLSTPAMPSSSDELNLGAFKSAHPTDVHYSYVTLLMGELEADGTRTVSTSDWAVTYRASSKEAMKLEVRGKVRKDYLKFLLTGPKLLPSGVYFSETFRGSAINTRYADTLTASLPRAGQLVVIFRHDSQSSNGTSRVLQRELTYERE